jgi:hypothetical protein
VNPVPAGLVVAAEKKLLPSIVRVPPLRGRCGSRSCRPPRHEQPLQLGRVRATAAASAALVGPGRQHLEPPRLRLGHADAEKVVVGNVSQLRDVRHLKAVLDAEVVVLQLGLLKELKETEGFGATATAAGTDAGIGADTALATPGAQCGHAAVSEG